VAASVPWTLVEPLNATAVMYEPGILS